MKILITAPSLDEKRNVSGISTVARQTIENSACEFVHFVAGRRDDEKASAAWLARQALLPIRFFQILKAEKPNLAHINTAFNTLSILRDFALVAAARAAKIPVLLHVHGGRFLSEDFKNKRLEKLTEKMLRSSSAIVVLSDLEKTIVEKRWKNLDVRVLENAVEAGEKSRLKNESREKTIIFLGRLHESKGLSEIVDVCRKLKNENLDFRFRAYGAGDLQEFFVAEMTKILGEKFFFGGVASGAEKRRALNEADIFLLPSRYGEGLPMALLEAMAARCVVVVSEMASIGAVVKDDVNGFLIEPRNVSQLFEKLKSLLSGEVDLNEIRENARATIEEKFNLSDYIVKLERIYRETADKNLPNAKR